MDRPDVVAVTGGNSFIGKHLVNALSKESSVEIRLLMRGKPDATMPGNVQTIRGNLLESTSLKRFLSPGCSVINMAYLWDASREDNLKAVDNLALACKETRVRRLVHCSTAVVVGRTPVENVTEETECRPFSEYEITKLAIEEHLLRQFKNYYETVILRPTIVFGPGSKNLVKVIQDIVKDNWIASYFRRSIFKNRRMNLVSVGNVVSALIFLLKDERNLNGKVFIVSDDDDQHNSYDYLRQSVMATWGIKKSSIPIIPFHREIERLILRLFRKSSLSQSRVYDSGKLARLGFERSSTFREEIDAYLSFHRQVLNKGRQ